MSILKLDELHGNGTRKGLSAEVNDSTEFYFASGKRSECAGETIGELRMGMTKHFVTAAQWGMHHLLDYLLSVTGPATVYLTLYSISEDPARVINALKHQGQITFLAGLVDWHVKRDKSRSLQTVRNCFDELGFQNVHAKIIAIENRDWALSVVASCNFNKNKRFEAGVITASMGACRFHRDWILNEIRK